MAGAAALAAETKKHIANDKKCQELGRACVPIAVETYGNWGQEAKEAFSRLASLWLLTPHNQSLKLLLSMENGHDGKRLQIHSSVGCAESLHLHLAYWKLDGGQEGQEHLQDIENTRNLRRYPYQATT